MLSQRIVTALALIGALVYIMFFSTPDVFKWTMLAVFLIAAYEWSSMFAKAFKMGSLAGAGLMACFMASFASGLNLHWRITIDFNGCRWYLVAFCNTFGVSIPERLKILANQPNMPRYLWLTHSRATFLCAFIFVWLFFGGATMVRPNVDWRCFLDHHRC